MTITFLLRLYLETLTIIVWKVDLSLQESMLDIFVSILSTGMAGLAWELSFWDVQQMRVILM